jgi:hypothetical protein
MGRPEPAVEESAQATTVRARYRQITCLTLAGIEKRDVKIPLDSRFDIPARGTKRLCDISGPGRIVRLWATLPVAWRGPVLRSAILRMFWDDETSPSVECPLGDFFGASFAKPSRLICECLTIAGGGYVCRFDMPFRRRAVIELENQSERRVRLFFFQIGYYEDESVPEQPETFHAQWRRQNPTTDGRPFVALEADGEGRLVGVKLDAQNRSWWLRPPVKKMFFPRGLGLGMLEGPESIRVDGEEPPSIVGTGTEDFFLGGWYFKGGPFQTPTHGVTCRSFLSGRVSAYRFLSRDPVPFHRSLILSFDHGVENDIKADYTSVTYWYQAEPHAEFPALPSAEDRRPTGVVMNAIQAVLGLSLLGGIAAAAFWLVRWVAGL